MIFNKKRSRDSLNMVEDHYTPCSLPSVPPGIETFVPSDYSANDPEYIALCYKLAEEKFGPVVATADHHFNGSEIDCFVESQMEHSIAKHEAEIARNNHQVQQIRNVIRMRKHHLDLGIPSIVKVINELESKIEPLKDLRPQFHLGPIPLGILVTACSMVFDAPCNYSFLQGIILSHWFLLMITVAGMSIMSDGAMCALATLLSHRKEEFMPRALFRAVCIFLAAMFGLSVVGSVMIRFGSMAQTYGTVNAAGEWIGKNTYSLAEYGATLVTAFLTTATGIISFVFSYDENAYRVSLRQQMEKKLASKVAELDSLRDERALLEGAPDPSVRDAEMRAVAEHQLEALRDGLKIHMRKMMALLNNEPAFTEKMAKSGSSLVEEKSPGNYTPEIIEAYNTPILYKASGSERREK